MVKVVNVPYVVLKNKNMSDEKFIEFAKIFLKYSFENLGVGYDELTDTEKIFLSKEEFELLIKKINE